jgi:hypothetical protein
MWIIALFLVCCVGFPLGFKVFGRKEIVAMPTDMREVTHGISTFFCSKVHIYSWDQGVNFYLLPFKPEIDPFSRKIYNATYTYPSVETRYYQHYVFYMLQDSFVTLTSHCDSQLDMYVFQGKDNFDTFNNNQVCDVCYIHNEQFTGSSRYSLSFTSTDSYYFVYVNRGLVDSRPLESHFYLDRTLYYLGDSILCQGSCDMYFEFNSFQSIVFEYGTDWQTPVTARVRSHCRPRISVYMLVFALPTFVFALGLTVLICFLSRRSAYKSKERRELLSDTMANRNVMIAPTNSATNRSSGYNPVYDNTSI